MFNHLFLLYPTYPILLLLFLPSFFKGTWTCNDLTPFAWPFQLTMMKTGVHPHQWDDETIIKALGIRASTSKRVYEFLREKQRLVSLHCVLAYAWNMYQHSTIPAFYVTNADNCVFSASHGSVWECLFVPCSVWMFSWTQESGLGCCREYPLKVSPKISWILMRMIAVQFITRFS